MPRSASLITAVRPGLMTHQCPTRLSSRLNGPFQLEEDLLTTGVDLKVPLSAEVPERGSERDSTVLAATAIAGAGGGHNRC